MANWKRCGLAAAMLVFVNEGARVGEVDDVLDAPLNPLDPKMSQAQIQALNQAPQDSLTQDPEKKKKKKKEEEDEDSLAQQPQASVLEMENPDDALAEDPEKKKKKKKKEEEDEDEDSLAQDPEKK